MRNGSGIICNRCFKPIHRLDDLGERCSPELSGNILRYHEIQVEEGAELLSRPAGRGPQEGKDSDLYFKEPIRITICLEIFFAGLSIMSYSIVAALRGGSLAWLFWIGVISGLVIAMHGVYLLVFHWD